MQPPVVAGVAGGVGTTTMAAALRGQDGGIYRPGAAVDVLVARATMVSLAAAQRALATTPEPHPLLVVVADQSRGGLPNNAEHRLRMTEGLTTGIVHVPFVEAWRHLDRPVESAYQTLTGGLTQQFPTRPARAFAEATRTVVRSLTPRLQAGPQHLSGASVAAAAAARTVTAGNGLAPLPATGSHQTIQRPAAAASVARLPRHRVPATPRARRR